MEERAIKEALEKNEQKELERLEESLAHKVVRLKEQRDRYKQKLLQVCRKVRFNFQGN